MNAAATAKLSDNKEDVLVLTLLRSITADQRHEVMPPLKHTCAKVMRELSKRVQPNNYY